MRMLASREWLIPGAPMAHLLIQIRHNLVLFEKPFFRRGRCVLKTAHHVGWSGKVSVFRMKPSRIASAFGGMALCALACALLWPHARQAAAMLAAQDDPVEISDIQLDSALRNDQAIFTNSIEAALAEGDADLAHS